MRMKVSLYVLCFKIVMDFVLFQGKVVIYPSSSGGKRVISHTLLLIKWIWFVFLVNFFIFLCFMVWSYCYGSVVPSMKRANMNLKLLKIFCLQDGMKALWECKLVRLLTCGYVGLAPLIMNNRFDCFMNYNALRLIVILCLS